MGIDMTENEEPRVTLHNIALSFIGRDASPKDRADDEYGCADSVNCVFKEAFGREIGGGASTAGLYQAMKYSPNFVKIWQDPMPGDIIISPTGYGDGRLPNGHVGIFTDNNGIMSNTSRTGLWEENFTLSSWIKRYREKGGYPILFYRVIK